eukprot:CAMPEP_0181184008 /NCGR_PEP_ID=MMETSP1096-20121128/8735_1 /TAXON_ID=156174 ORGANISM="Chrysochromulina ericina, Strain CCMP281" /NCGR_SAMPLE_ID=MMETSP1096 /ASSEMBLY_ACC=CAM_ASM_000453 /LENGTH=56 /DNA_ID=CAMNT_0023272737 /DNA_START=64 /DNA_END=234 /DNA_ORIENTATION=+
MTLHPHIASRFEELTALRAALAVHCFSSNGVDWANAVAGDPSPKTAEANTIAVFVR